MTVAELIELLQKYPPDKTVMMEWQDFYDSDFRTPEVYEFLMEREEQYLDKRGHKRRRQVRDVPVVVIGWE